MSRVRLGLAVAFIVGSSVPGVAADLGQPYLAAQASAFSWTRIYVGVHGGYGWGNSGDLSMDGALGGGQLGYNYQAGFFVLGFEGDIAGANLTQSFSNAIGFGTAKVHALGSARARFGVAANTVLFYGTVGAGWAKDELTSNDNASGLVFTSSGWNSGWVAGGGIEWAFLPSFTAKVEYLHYGLGSQSYFGVLNTTNVDIDTVKVGINYLFP